jgi:hypothetical protein
MVVLMREPGCVCTDPSLVARVGHEARCPLFVAWDDTLSEARNLDGSQRFFPADEHPATYRLRRHREALDALPETPEREAALAHIDRQLAAFERGEDRAKRDYLRAKGVSL